MEIIVENLENSIRIDNYLSDNYHYSRTKIQKMCTNGYILLNGKNVKNSQKIKNGDIINLQEMEEEQFDLEPLDMNLDIVYEDDDVIVLNKANGVIVHPSISNNKSTLVNGLLFHSKELSDLNGEFRPGIVHRIDSYTTGLIMIAKNNNAHEFLSKQLEDKTTHRKYIALVWGNIKHDTGTIDAPIGRSIKERMKMDVTNINSKHAVTHFKVLERYENATLIECMLETGRTHQIRVHMNYINHPIVNDPVYGKRKIINDFGQCLHAKELGFIHPTTKENMLFSSDIPKEMQEIIDMFK